MLSIAFAMIIVNCHIAKADVTGLQQNDKGQYCISTAEEYYFFVENYRNAPYKTSTVILTNDIEITNQVTGLGTFSGIFNGQGHTITYSATDRTLNKKGISVISFSLDANGVLENLKIKIEKTKIYVGDTTYSNIVFSSNNGLIKGLKVTGNVALVCDDLTAKWNVAAGIGAGSGKVENSEFSISYGLESTMTADEIAQKIIDKNLGYNIAVMQRDQFPFLGANHSIHGYYGIVKIGRKYNLFICLIASISMHIFVECIIYRLDCILYRIVILGCNDR